MDKVNFDDPEHKHLIQSKILKKRQNSTIKIKYFLHAETEHNVIIMDLLSGHHDGENFGNFI